MNNMILSLLFLLCFCSCNKQTSNQNYATNSTTVNKRELEILASDVKKEISLVESPSEEKVYLNFPKSWKMVKQFVNGNDQRLLFSFDEENIFLVMTNNFSEDEIDVNEIGIGIAIDFFSVIETSNFMSKKIGEHFINFAIGKTNKQEYIGIATITIKKQVYFLFCMDDTNKLETCSRIINTIKIGNN